MALTHYIKNRFDGNGSPLKKCDLSYIDQLNADGSCSLVQYSICVCSNDPTGDRPKLLRMKFSDYVAATDPNGVFAELTAELAAKFPNADYRIIRPKIKKDLTGKDEHEICFDLVPYSFVLITSPGGLGEIVCEPECTEQIIHRSCKYGVIKTTPYKDQADKILGYDNTMSPSPTNGVPDDDDMVPWESLVETIKICCTKEAGPNQNPCPGQEVGDKKKKVNSMDFIPLPNMDVMEAFCWRLISCSPSSVKDGKATMCITYESAGTMGDKTLKYATDLNPAEEEVDPCAPVYIAKPDISHPWSAGITPPPPTP